MDPFSQRLTELKEQGKLGVSPWKVWWVPSEEEMIQQFKIHLLTYKRIPVMTPIKFTEIGAF